jgi:hypothetical protein
LDIDGGCKFGFFDWHPVNATAAKGGQKKARWGERA